MSTETLETVSDTGQAFAILIDVDRAGAHPAAWRVSPDAPRELLSAAVLTRAVRAAELAGFTAVTFDDHPLPSLDAGGPTARVDAVIRASLNAPLTSSIGLIPVVHGIYSEPFHVATQIATLDTASLGRAGWIAVADPHAGIASRYGREPLGADVVDAEFADVVEVVRRLWDSWEDDAVIRDVATGRYLDRDKLHYADFVGERFAVKGPLIIPRSPQGQPPIIAAAGTAAEIDFALIDAPTDDAGELVDGVASAAASARSRHAPGVRLLLQLEVVLDHAGQTGAQRLDLLDEHVSWTDAGRSRYVGDANGLVQLLTSLRGTVDGVRIFPAVLGADLEEVGRAVLPALRATGVFGSPRIGETLRQTLGLPRPVNRFAEAAR